MMPNLPPNWTWVKIGDVGEVVAGGTPSTKIPEYFDGKISWITPADLTGYRRKYISQGRKSISEEGLKNSSARIIPKGSILFSSRAPIGYVAIASNELCTNQGFKNLIPNKKVDSGFVYYYLKSAKQLAEKNASGTTFKEISSTNFKQLPFPLPPLPEQKKIVEKIEELFSGLDSGVASLKKAKEQIRLYRQSVLSAAFSGKLVKDEKRETKEELVAHLNGVQGASNKKVEHLNGIQEVTEQEMLEHLPYKQVVPKAAEPKVGYGKDLPEGWKWVKLGEVCHKIGDVDHKMPKPVENGKYPYLSTKDFTDDLKIDFKKAKLISEEDFNLLSRKIKPQKGDIIFPRYGTIGKNVLVDCDKEFLVSYSCAVIKPNTEKIVTKYLYHYSLSPLIQKEIKKYTVQTTQANVGIESIKNFIVPLPTIIQQTQIVEEIEKRFSEADNLEKAIDESLAKSETLRQSILKQAFCGKLIINNEELIIKN